MNANFGLFPELTEQTEKGRRLKGRAARREAYCRRGAADFKAWLAGERVPSAAE